MCMCADVFVCACSVCVYVFKCVYVFPDACVSYACVRYVFGCVYLSMYVTCYLYSSV